ncbi:hypothetical protein OFO03_07605 [Campylobacter sp. JMF_02 ED1]|uniref:hypothetical protein n=1 Tax=unclassified Campylobacter TaxID=2593542 RepID=UPI0022E99A79|nr:MULTISPECIES: hypothetical protein [unclassified Campylobacter]MDA3050089.1 hypothetical protein [Campylobacter sp. JMF_15 NE4]MDA3051765.1 hypothetical protein [Campylobacter sp. JMF_02 ED1]
MIREFYWIATATASPRNDKLNKFYSLLSLRGDLSPKQNKRSGGVRSTTGLDEP